MSLRASAARYARALLDVAKKESSPEQVEQELASFADLVAGHADLRDVLTNPVIPVSGKLAVTQELLTRLALSGPVAKILLMLAERDRVVLLPDLLAVYRERLMDYHNVVRADVTTAEPLAEDRVTQLQDRLAHVTGRRVTMKTNVDPAIIGGVVARIGGTVYDGSVATQLARIREKLLEQH